ncbi:hypothetical protein SLS53_008608 [Cytospora paraplurivora]|uniref:Uncharacterized protein n=1 Tax=Cytospora paraplurivora TaxID=2898453 RepID=A0AAN9TZX0_9PEZI
MVYGDFNVVICHFGDTSVLYWPPAFLNRLNMSSPYHANCFNFTFNNAKSNIICDYGYVEVIHWSKQEWQSQDEPNVGVLPRDMALTGEPETPEEITDELLFDTPLDGFTARRNNRDPKDLIWDSDGCTHAPDNPMGFPFEPACQRHDFGYRNYRAQNRLDKTAQKEINKQFKAE